MPCVPRNNLVSHCGKNLAFLFSLFRFVSLSTVLLTEKLGLVVVPSVYFIKKPTHALLLNTLSHPHFKTPKLFKKSFVKTSLKPYMFRSLLYDHPQGSSFVLSALPLLRLFDSSRCLFGMWLYVVYVCVCARRTCLWDVWSFTTRHPTDRYVGHARTHTHTHRQHTATYRIRNWTNQISGEVVMH
jgi:hypothetical protein